ncbi:hypothetical protein H9J87_000891 [Escherichia coli]|uniref:DUF7668 domain-containing protein n=1 Tax=Yersinia ruckeri TaxID=29486 RepID=A4IUH4_YERRU|nr:MULTISPECIES: hypothetical protein [Gammaproteobacteria]EBN5355226.1 hypothetical protein [Salmonella enterica subsp. enterica serovar Cerro]EEL8949508.1 hypothetical protein [Salmonella enterica subsp. enterica serovar Montevideo]HAT0822749.1 hypothetical protein [Salmonella enterica subsp. enterica]ABO40913.1 conserved hypothetical protein [Yersinia ruckeri]EFN8254552.1 hypothetical protein [Escherichia coli]
MNEDIKKLVKKMVEKLVNGDFDSLVLRGENGRLSVEEIKTAITDFSGLITLPPIQAYDSIEVYDVYDASCGARKVDFDLWFDNEKSDLTVSMEVRMDGLGKLGLIIEDIHFL